MYLYLLAVSLLLARGCEAFWRLPCQGDGAALVVQRAGASRLRSQSNARRRTTNRSLLPHADPITNPGLASGHVHTISGGSNFNLDVDFQTLRQSKFTSCMVKQDMSNYWTPTRESISSFGTARLLLLDPCSPPFCPNLPRRHAFKRHSILSLGERQFQQRRAS